MSTLIQVKGVTYTRDETRKKLGLKSPTTLVKYCKRLGIPRGLHYFTSEEFEKMQTLRNWRARGGRYEDFPLKDQNLDKCA